MRVHTTVDKVLMSQLNFCRTTVFSLHDHVMMLEVLIIATVMFILLFDAICDVITQYLCLNVPLTCLLCLCHCQV